MRVLALVFVSGGRIHVGRVAGSFSSIIDSSSADIGCSGPIVDSGECSGSVCRFEGSVTGQRPSAEELR